MFKIVDVTAKPDPSLYFKYVKEFNEHISKNSIKAPSGEYHYLYRITNLINGKIYIGRRTSTVDPQLDMYYMGSGVAIRNAISFYGKSNFRKEILALCDTFCELCALEASIVTPEFVELTSNYNLKSGGIFGGSLSEESRLKNSRTQLGRKLPIDLVERMNEGRRIRGYKHPDSVKASLSSSRSSSQNRPWLNNRLKLDPSRLSIYFYLDNLYLIYLDLDMSLRGSKAKFIRLVKNSLNLDISESIKTIVKYFKQHGNPNTDPSWISFKSGELN